MISAYYNSFRELSCVNEVLYSFRRCYLNNQIIFVNNGGDVKLEKIAVRYKCKYYYEDDNIPNDKNLSNVLKQIKRFLSYIQLINTEWILLLTDDILILNCISNYENILYDINSKKINNQDYNYLSGAILKTSFFKNLSMEISKVEDDIMKLGNNKNLNFNMGLNYLVNNNNGTIGNYHGYNDMSCIKDLKNKYKDNLLITLSNYKLLNNFSLHPNLLNFVKNKYTIVIYITEEENYYNNILTQYIKYIDIKDIYELIIIGNDTELNHNIKFKDIKFKNIKYIYYNLYVICKLEDNNNKMIKKLLPLAICKYVKTEHYIVIDQNYIISKSTKYEDLFSNNRILFYSKTWRQLVDDHSTWMASLQVRTLHASSVQNFIHPYNLIIQNSLMINGPQLLCSNIVYQLLYSMDGNIETIQNKNTSYNWKETILRLGASPYELYWIYLMETLRTNYYKPSDKFVI